MKSSRVFLQAVFVEGDSAFVVTEVTGCWTLAPLCPGIPGDHKKQEDAEAKAVQCLGEGAGAEEEGELEIFFIVCFLLCCLLF